MGPFLEIMLGVFGLIVLVVSVGLLTTARSQ